MLSVPHLIVIFIVALVVFGPEKLPELARTLGKVMAEFRRHTGDLRSTFEGHLREIEREADTRRIAATPATAVPFPAAEPQTAPSAPGTVTSNAPNAASIAAAASEHSPEAMTDPGSNASHPDDTALMPAGIPAREIPGAAQSSEPESPEHLTHGDIHPS